MQDFGLHHEDFIRIFTLIKEHKDSYLGSTLIKVPPAIVPPNFLHFVFKESRVGNSVGCQFPLLGILPSGDITVCAMSRNDPSLRFGNVKESTLTDVWAAARMDLLRQSYTEATSLKGICGDCVWKYSCKGSCRAWAYEEGDGFDSPFPVCQALYESGGFPQAYRLSVQNSFAKNWLQLHKCCACPTE